MVRGGAGLFFDRVPLRAVANALLSAGNTTDVTQLRQPQVIGHPADAGRRAGVPEHPARPPAVDRARLDHDDGQEPAERLLEAGQRRGRARARRQPDRSRVGYQYFRGENLLMSINQNVPTCVAAGTNNGCRPVSTYMNNSQYQRRRRRRTTTACT